MFFTKNIFVFLISTLFCVKSSFGAQSEVREFNFNNINFSLNIPKNWRVTKDLHGIPLTVLSPKKSNSKRAVITIIPSKLKGISFKDIDTANFNKEYQTKRREWIKKQHAGVAIRFENLEKLAMGLYVGFKYRLFKNVYRERSYYLICANSVFHLKSIVENSAIEYLENTYEIIGSLKCKK